MLEQRRKILDYAQACFGHVPLTEAFAVRLVLASPVAGYDALHLDALLQKAVVVEALHGQPLQAQSTPYLIPVPLQVLWRSAQGIPLYHCSSLLPEGEVVAGSAAWTKKNEVFASRMTARKRNGDLWQPDSRAGTYKEYLMRPPTTDAHCLLGYGVGDIASVQRLLRLFLTLGIGKKCGTGFGALNAIEVFPCTPSRRYVFLSGEAQPLRLLRPVPLAALPTLGLSAEGEPTRMAYSPPYWLPAHAALCYAEGTPVTQRRASIETRHDEAPGPLRSSAHFLCFCQERECLRQGGTLTLRHPKFQADKGIGERCAVTGLRIEAEGAVAAKDVLSEAMGNAVDYLQAPGSSWISHEVALLFADVKKWHRAFVALISPDCSDGWLLWPTIGVDVTNPRQGRPLWREVLLTMSSRFRGFHCLILFKDEPKSRLWPRARIGTVGAQTPLWFAETESGRNTLLSIDIDEACRQLLLIESWLDQGYSKRALRHGIMAASHLSRSLPIESHLHHLRTTQEFPLALVSARSKEDREKRGLTP